MSLSIAALSSGCVERSTRRAQAGQRCAKIMADRTQHARAIIDHVANPAAHVV